MIFDVDVFKVVVDLYNTPQDTVYNEVIYVTARGLEICPKIVECYIKKRYPENRYTVKFKEITLISDDNVVCEWIDE